jgi:hypothetical protein
MRRQQSASVARWLIVILLTVIATCLLMEVRISLSAAHADEAGEGGAGGVFAVAGKVTPETYGVYLVDLKRNTLCLYQYLSGSRKLRLMAARTFAFDRMLEEYNTEPDVREIRKLVEEHRTLSGATTRP